MEQGFLLPDLGNADVRGFWEGTAQGELRIQRCADCGARRMPPRPMCPHCRSLASHWEAVSGEGTIWSWVVAHPPLLPAYAALAPYPVVTVSLAEDPSLRLVGNLVATPHGPINEVDPATIEIGQPVRAVFAPIEDVQLPRWIRYPGD
jgi:uncharacterized OB-fold protein